MNKRQAKKKFKATYGEKIWRMRMPDLKKKKNASRKKRKEKKC